MKIISLSLPRDITNGQQSVNATIQDGNDSLIISIADDHPSYRAVLNIVKDFQNKLISAENLAEAIVEASDLKRSVSAKFKKIGGILDGRMAINGEHVTVDYEPVDPVLEAHIFRMLDEDGSPKDSRNWRAFAKFIENLYGNTSEFVRNQLFGWMTYENLHGQGLTLTDDGCFIGYKGCEGTPEMPMSIRSGNAIVNGVPMHGQVPNQMGSTVAMRRSEVCDDPAIGCAPGLHVGTFAYAKSWSRGVLLTVKVNPRDVVSVPVCSDAQKIRVCRYEVIEIVEQAYTSVTRETLIKSDVEIVSDEVTSALEDAEGTDAVVTVGYVDKRGRNSTREVHVDELDGRHVHVTDLTNGGPRTLLIHCITSVSRAEDETDTEDETDVKSTLETAIAEGVDVTIDYVSKKGKRSSRLVTPEEIIRAGTILRGHCHKSGGTRTFNLAGIEAVSIESREIYENLTEALRTRPDKIVVAVNLEDILENAIEKNLDLMIEYVDQKKRRTGRIITPDVIYSNEGKVRAFCHNSDDFRTFLLKGILSVTVVSDDQLDPEIEEEIARNGYSDEAPMA